MTTLTKEHDSVAFHILNTRTCGIYENSARLITREPIINLIGIQITKLITEVINLIILGST